MMPFYGVDTCVRYQFEGEDLFMLLDYSWEVTHHDKCRVQSAEYHVGLGDQDQDQDQEHDRII
jgi:hypothetical protein